MLTSAATAFLALNAAPLDGVCGEGLALNAAADGESWQQLLPAGPVIRGVDGRTWRLANPQALVEAFNAARLALPVDINHAQNLRAPKGEESPAAGWIEEVAVREGKLFGRIVWTARGREALNARDYRYISPVFRFDAAGNVVALRGAGLVNSPNFEMPALNAQANGDASMLKDLLTKLGLAETATAGEAIAAIDKLQTAANAQKQPALADFVPRAEFDVALNRANEAEKKLSDQAKAAHDARVSAVVDGALKAGKILPATKDYYTATCASAEGLAEFEKFLAAQPSVFKDAGLDKRSAEDGDVALNAQEKDVCAAMGLTAEEFNKARAA